MFNYAALINLMVTYLVVLIPQLGTGVMRIAIISILTLLLALVNHIGVKNAARFSTVFTIAKLIPLLLFIVAGLFFLQTENITVTTPPSTADFSQAVLLLIFAFGGFESVLINTGEVAEPRKNLPVALFTAIGVVALFYCAIQLVCMGTLTTLSTSTTPVADAARTFSGNTGSWLIAAGAVISITGTLNVLMLSGSRLPYAFAVEKQLPLFFSYVHQRYRTPTFSLMAFALLTLAVSLFWSFLTAITVGAIIRLLVYLFVCVSLIRLRQKNPASKEHFRLKGGVLLPVLAIGLSIWLLSASSVKEIRAVFYCLLAGLAVYLLNRGFSKAGKQE
jgi:amino acid transporter